ncbi:MAG: hypothetical protein IKH57_26550 [Clostridia bacterium]|nr:hypothetical protein [Clostridia bacterium]
MCYGIEAYATTQAAEESKKTFVEAAQLFGQSLANTIKAFIAKYNVSEDVAEQDGKKYWKN